MSITFEFLRALISSKEPLLFIELLSFFFKLFILAACIRFIFKTSSQRFLLFFLLTFLTISLLNDSANIFYTIKRGIFGIKDDFPAFTFFIRFVWGLNVTQYQAIALFMEALMEKRMRFRFIHIPHAAFNIAISSAFMYLAIFKYGVSGASPETLPTSQALMHAIYIYLPVLYIPLFYKIYKRKTAAPQPIPHILAHQLRSLTNFLVPFLFCDMLGNCSTFLASFFIPSIKSFEYLFFTLSAMLSTYPLYFVGRRMLGLRFLNLRKDVESKEKFNFLSQFRDILEQLSYATALKELAHLNQAFFQAAFNIPLGRTRLYIRKAEAEKDDHGFFDIAHISANVESFIGKSDNQPIMRLLNSSKIFIRDEIEFSHFYEGDAPSKAILDFLDIINADLFLPIYERNTIIAYIIIERNARSEKLFTNKERDEMLVFTSYLSNIINILKYSNVEVMHHRHKELTEELYHKHQEINQYKESIRSFLRSNKERKIGIVFYKNRRFTFANEAAQELIGMDINTNVGHSLAQAFKTVARRVQEFKTAQTIFAQDINGTRVIIAGIPSLEEYTTILLMYYPEISDLIRAQFDQLKDPSSWDYVLYLETTQSGQLINQLLPGTGEKILNFKINLLSTALSKKATLLDMPEGDLMATVEILHHISVRQTLHSMTLTGPEKNDEVALKLFGLNPLLQKDASDPLLLKLNDTGTLYIQNIEYLSLETQNYLAHFILYGYFHKFKSDHKVFSNVRIICSTTKDLLELVNGEKFSKALYNELNKTSLTLPSLQSFSDSEIKELAQGFAEQIDTTQTYKNLLALTERDKHKLATDRPVSLREFKESVQQLLIEKSTKHNIHEITHFDPAYDVTEPDIAHAVRLGKKALKDPQMMIILWNKFKNQNRIATLLGVNRSSVNRRCQEYNLK